MSGAALDPDARAEFLEAIGYYSESRGIRRDANKSMTLSSRKAKSTVSRKVWIYDPHRGGRKIPTAVHEQTERRIQAYAAERHAGKYTKLDIRFRGALCYIDAFIEPAQPTDEILRSLGETREEHMERLRSAPFHLCRLRYFGRDDAWSMTFFTYSNERYEPCAFEDGSFTGTPEQAFEIGSVYLD